MRWNRRRAQIFKWRKQTTVTWSTGCEQESRRKCKRVPSGLERKCVVVKKPMKANRKYTRAAHCPSTQCCPSCRSINPHYVYRSVRPSAGSAGGCPPPLAVAHRPVHQLRQQRPHLAVGETVILLHPPLSLVGVSIVMERGCQRNDSLADGYHHRRHQQPRPPGQHPTGGQGRVQPPNHNGDYDLVERPKVAATGTAQTKSRHDEEMLVE